jgi:hypothetical protein
MAVFVDIHKSTRLAYGSQQTAKNCQSKVREEVQCQKKMKIETI